MPRKAAFPDNWRNIQVVDPQTGRFTPEFLMSFQDNYNTDVVQDGNNFQRIFSDNLLAPSAPFNGDNEQFADSAFVAYGWTPNYIPGSIGTVTRNNYRRANGADAFRGNYAQQMITGANLTDGASRASRPEDVKEFLQYEINNRAKILKRPSSGNHGYRIEVDWFSDDSSLARGGSGFLSTTVVQSGTATPFAADNAYQVFNGIVTAPAGAKFARIVEANWAPNRSVSESIVIVSDTFTWKLRTLNTLSRVTGSTIGPSHSGAFAVIDEMSITRTFNGGKVLCIFTGSISSDTANTQGLFGIFLDGSQDSAVQVKTFPAVANLADIVCISHISLPSAGSHTFDARWRTDAGNTLTASALVREFQVLELP